MFFTCPQDSLSFNSNPLHPETTSNGQKMTKMTKAWASIATIKENPDITFRCPQDSQGHCESQCVRDLWEQRANVCWSDSLCLLLCLFSTLKTSQNRPFCRWVCKLCLHVVNLSNLKSITRNTRKSQWANEPKAFAAAIRAVYCVSSQPPTVPSDIAVPRGLFITPGLPVV